MLKCPFCGEELDEEYGYYLCENPACKLEEITLKEWAIEGYVYLEGVKEAEPE